MPILNDASQPRQESDIFGFDFAAAKRSCGRADDEATSGGRFRPELPMSFGCRVLGRPFVNLADPGKEPRLASSSRV